ncbi:hypothetical protein RSAG8_09201, partial [Rhizoctonia solani AG-8 WAC10335]
MKFFTIVTVLAVSTSMVVGSPSSRFQTLNRRQLQGEGCRLFRRGCPKGQVCLGGILSARCYVSCSGDSDVFTGVQVYNWEMCSK